LIFVDSTFWIGDSDTSDDFHTSAREVIEAVRKGEIPLALTTGFVLSETVTILGRRKGYGSERASKVGWIILSSPRVLTVFIDEPLMKETLELYPAFKGKMGITDVSSVVVMKKYGAREIFSHDQDFDTVLEIIRRDKVTRR
jgi:predicted nucleic acid-binding protein